MKLKTLIQAGCSFLAFIFIFLPWITVSMSMFGISINESGNAFQNSGVVGAFALISALAALGWYVLCILKALGILKFKLESKVEMIIDITVPSLVILFGIIGIAVAFANGSGLTHAGVGAWLFTILGVAMLALHFVKLDTVVGKAPAKKSEKKESEKKEEKKEAKKDEK